MKLSSLATLSLCFIACGGEADNDLFDPVPGGAGGRAPGAGAANGGNGGFTIGATTGGGTTGGSAIGGVAGAGGPGVAGTGVGGSKAGAGGLGGSAAASAGAGAPATGGRGGSSGGGSGGKSSCDTLIAAADRLLPAAQACNLALSSRLPCSGFVEDQCGCKVAVDLATSPATRAYSDAVATASSQCLISCPAVVCPEPTSATCVTEGSETVGTCVATPGAKAL